MKVRQPTVDEAVKIMRMAMTDQQRQINLSYWRNKYGDAYAKAIESKYRGDK